MATGQQVTSAQAAPVNMMSADPAASAAGGQDDDSSGFVIEIECDSQGNITVSLESAGQEASESSGAEDDSNETPAKNIEDALKIAREMYAAQTGGGMSAQDAWDQEASKRGPATATA